MNDQKTFRNSLIGALVVALLAVVGLTIALVVVLVNNSSDTTENSENPISMTKDPYQMLLQNDVNMHSKIRTAIFTEMDKESPQRMKQNLRWLSDKVHVGGTDEQLKIMSQIESIYRSLGFDILVTDYNVLLDYPDYNRPNTISVSGAGGWTLISDGLAGIVGPPEVQKQLNNTHARTWWNAFAKAGNSTAELVYANYGRIEDFATLEKEGVTIKDRIVLMRFGQLWRGAKVSEAQKRGAVGVILYSDPGDYGPLMNETSDNVFPHSGYLPPGAAQRGTVMNFDGDAQTELHPSKPYAFRGMKTEEELRESGVLANIPVTPVGYGVAAKIFEAMVGAQAPDNFQGAIEGITYRLESGTGNRFRLSVNSGLKVSPIKNVCAYKKGRTEPDRFVIMGNHVDAWTFGAVDPNSGTMLLLELARVLMKTMNDTDWQPRRTLMLCNWDAEEYGLIGSVEFIEEMVKPLEGRAVTYLNVDSTLGANFSLLVAAQPSLYRAVVRAAKLVASPLADEVAAGRTTLYDTWQHFYPQNHYVTGIPKMRAPGSGSDHSTFMSYLGVPVANVDLGDPPESTRGFNLYHTMYEIPWLVENIFDPKFTIGASLAKLWVEIARDIADSLVIPFNVSDYGPMLETVVTELDTLLSDDHHQLNRTDRIPQYHQMFANLTDAIARYTTAAGEFQRKIDDANSASANTTLIQVESLNKRLTDLERSFINSRGIYPGRPQARHVVFASSLQNKYAGATLPGVSDSAAFYVQALAENDAVTAEKWLRQTQLALTDVQYAIESAIHTLSL